MYFTCMKVLPACISVYRMQAQCLQRASDPSELELQIFTSYCVGFGNQGQVFWMNSQYSLLLSPLSTSPKNILFNKREIILIILKQ